MWFFLSPAAGMVTPQFPICACCCIHSFTPFPPHSFFVDRDVLFNRKFGSVILCVGSLHKSQISRACLFRFYRLVQANWVCVCVVWAYR
jgi:hypothetical protein